MNWLYLVLYVLLGVGLVVWLALWRRGVDRPLFLPAMVFVVVGYLGLYMTAFGDLIHGRTVFPDDRGIGPYLEDEAIGAGMLTGEEGFLGAVVFIVMGLVILYIGRRNARRAARERERESAR